MRSSFIIAAAASCTVGAILLLVLPLATIASGTNVRSSFGKQTHHRQPLSAYEEGGGGDASTVSQLRPEVGGQVAAGSDPDPPPGPDGISDEAPHFSHNNGHWRTKASRRHHHHHRHPPQAGEGRQQAHQRQSLARSLTKTYERIVLEGSKVRIGCPHVSPSSLQQTHATREFIVNSDWRYRPHKKLEQFTASGSRRGEGANDNDSNKLNLGATSMDEDHEPQQLQQQKQHQPNTKRVKWFRNHVPILNLNDFARNPSSSSYRDFTQMLSGREQLETKTVMKLHSNKTTELSELSAPSEPIEDDLTSWHEVGRFDFGASKDGNELADERKSFNLAPDSNSGGEQWHINEFGELVINEVSKYLAGRYTCLADGRQSEVLIDVLPNDQFEQQQHQLQLQQDSGRQNLKKLDRKARANKAANSEITKDTSRSTSDVNSLSRDLAPNPTAKSQVAWNFDVTRLVPSPHSLDLSRLVGAGADGQVAHSLRHRGQAASARGAGRGVGNHRAQHTQIHLVDSETIRAEDLKLIPGFLYTRQQLICPVSSFGTALSMDQIDSLVAALCPTTLISNSSDTDREACELLAGRLASWLVNGRHLFNCSDWPLELVWFKDGVRLEFEPTTGRVSNSDLDIKLTDSTSPNPDNVGYTTTTSTTSNKVHISRQQQQQQRGTRASELSSMPTPRTTPTEASVTSSSSSWLSLESGMCFRKGRVLVIDGVQRDSAGYYTCALQLSIAKLEKIIQSLQEQMNRGSDNNNNENRRAANGIQQAQLAGDSAAGGDRDQMASETDQSSIDGAIKTIELFSINGTNEREPELQSLVADGDSMMKRIALMELIMADRFAAKQSTATIKRLVSSLENPLATMQTFSLVVATRAADSCDLWSTVLEADNAYTSRRLADFKRLKGNRDHDDRGRDLATGPPASVESSARATANENGRAHEINPTADHRHHYRWPHAYAENQEPIKSSDANHLSGRDDDELSAAAADDDDDDGSGANSRHSSGRISKRSQMRLRRSPMNANEHLETGAPFGYAPQGARRVNKRLAALGGGPGSYEGRQQEPGEQGRRRNQISSRIRRRRRRQIDGNAEAQPLPVGLANSRARDTMAPPSHTIEALPPPPPAVHSPILLLNNADKQLNAGWHTSERPTARTATLLATEASTKLVLVADQKPTGWIQEETVPFNYANEANFDPNKVANATATTTTRANNRDGERPKSSDCWPPPPPNNGKPTKAPLTSRIVTNSEVSGANSGNHNRDSKDQVTNYETKDLIKGNDHVARKWYNDSRFEPSGDKILAAARSTQPVSGGDSIEWAAAVATTPAAIGALHRDDDDDDHHHSRSRPLAAPSVVVMDVGTHQPPARDDVAMLSTIDDKLPPNPQVGTGNDGVGAKMSFLASDASEQKLLISARRNQVGSESLTMATDSLLLPINFDVPKTHEATATEATGQGGQAAGESGGRLVSNHIAHDDPWRAHKLLALKSGPVVGGLKSVEGETATEAPGVQGSSGRKTTDKSRDFSSIDNFPHQRVATEANASAPSDGGKWTDKSLIRKQRQVAQTGQADDGNYVDLAQRLAPNKIIAGDSDQTLVRLGSSSSSSSSLPGSGEYLDDKSGPADRGNDDATSPIATPIEADTTNSRQKNVLTPAPSVDDETLLWQAGQYLYMHMRALAASSIYGVQVDVEWSNERINSSETEFQQQQSTGNLLPEASLDAYPSAYLGTRDASPFAVIDVISGQNLHLQCTAQAFGRLPEVAWYKRIDLLPERLAKMANKTRRIGTDLYWPLTEIDAISERDDGVFDSIPFVSSQSTTIFDNLVNQTFTVVQKLQLSQYNDSSYLSASGSKQPNKRTGLSENVNLYACIVDADVRHNYATLGVHFREAPSRIPPDISKRLQAQSAFFSRDSSSSAMANDDFAPIQPEAGNFANYDMFRESHYHLPLKSSYWVPLQNKTLMDEGNLLNTSNLTPTMLTIIIGFVSVSLLGLVYLTMRSYQSLTHLQLEQDLDLAYTSVTGEDGDEPDMASMQVYLQKGAQSSNYDVITETTTHTGCSCLLNSLAPQVDYSDASAIELTNFVHPKDSCELDIYRLTEDGVAFYDPHSNQELQPVGCSSVLTSLMPDHEPSIGEHLYDGPLDLESQVPETGYRETIFDCCQQQQYQQQQQQQMPNLLVTSERISRVNMIQNPIDCQQDDESMVPAGDIIQKQQVVVTRTESPLGGGRPTEL